MEAPDLVGRPSGDAARELVARGLSPRVRFVPDGGDPGSVGRQEPGAGVAEAGTIVTLFVVRPAR